MSVSATSCSSCVDHLNELKMKTVLLEKAQELANNYENELSKLAKENEQLQRKLGDKIIELNDNGMKIRSLEEQLQSALDRNKINRADVDGVISRDLDRIHSQMVYKDNKIMDLNNTILEKERNILDLQEMCREQSELVQAKAKAFHIVQKKLLDLESRSTREHSTETDGLLFTEEKEEEDWTANVPSRRYFLKDFPYQAHRSTSSPGQAVALFKLGNRGSPPPNDPSEEQSSIGSNTGDNNVGENVAYTINATNIDGPSSVSIPSYYIKHKKNSKRVTFDLPPSGKCCKPGNGGNNVDVNDGDSDDDVAQAIIELTSENDQLRQTIREMEGCSNETQKRLQNMEVELDQVRREGRNQVLKTRASMQSRIHDFEEKITAMTLEHAEKVEHLNGTVETLRSDREWTLDENSRLLKQLNSYKEKISDAWQAVDEKQCECEKLRLKLEQDRVLVVRLADDLEEAERAANALLDLRTLILEDVERLKEALEAQDEYIELLEADVLIYERHIGLLRDSLGASKIEKRTLIKSKAFGAKLKALEQEKEQISKKSNDEKLHIKALTLKIVSLEEENGMLLRRINDLERSGRNEKKYFSGTNLGQVNLAENWQQNDLFFSSSSAFSVVQPTEIAGGSTQGKFDKECEHISLDAYCMSNSTVNFVTNDPTTYDQSKKDEKKILSDDELKKLHHDYANAQEKLVQLGCVNFELENELKDAKELVKEVKEEAEMINQKLVELFEHVRHQKSEQARLRDEHKVQLGEVQRELMRVNRELSMKGDELQIALEEATKRQEVMKQWKFGFTEIEAVHRELRLLENQLKDEREAMESKWSEVRSMLVERESDESRKTSKVESLSKEQNVEIVIERSASEILKLNSLVDERNEIIKRQNAERRQLKAAIRMLQSNKQNVQRDTKATQANDRERNSCSSMIDGLLRQCHFMDNEMTMLFDNSATKESMINHLRGQVNKLIAEKNDLLHCITMKTEENTGERDEPLPKTTKSVELETHLLSNSIADEPQVAQTDPNVPRICVSQLCNASQTDANALEELDRQLLLLSTLFEEQKSEIEKMRRDNDALRQRENDHQQEIATSSALPVMVVPMQQHLAVQTDDIWPNTLSLVRCEHTFVHSDPLSLQVQQSVSQPSILNEVKVQNSSVEVNRSLACENSTLRTCVTESSRVQNNLSEDLNRLMILNAELETAVEMLRGEIWSLNGQLKASLADREDLSDKLCELSQKHEEGIERSRERERELEEQKDMAERSQRQAALADNESNRRLVEWQEKSTEMEQSRVELENAYERLSEYYQQLQEAYNALYSRANAYKVDGSMMTSMTASDIQEKLELVELLKVELERRNRDLEAEGDELLQLRSLLTSEMRKALDITRELRELNLKTLREFMEECKKTLRLELEQASERISEGICAIFQWRIQSNNADVNAAIRLLIDGVLWVKSEFESNPLSLAQVAELVIAEYEQKKTEISELKALLIGNDRNRSDDTGSNLTDDINRAKNISKKVKELEEHLKSTQTSLSEHVARCGDLQEKLNELGCAAEESASAADCDGTAMMATAELNSLCPHTICREMMPTVPSPTQLQLAILAARLTTKIADNDALFRCNAELAHTNVRLQNELEELGEILMASQLEVKNERRSRGKLQNEEIELADRDLAHQQSQNKLVMTKESSSQTDEENICLIHELKQSESKLGALEPAVAAMNWASSCEGDDRQRCSLAAEYLLKPSEQAADEQQEIESTEFLSSSEKGCRETNSQHQINDLLCKLNELRDELNIANDKNSRLVDEISECNKIIEMYNAAEVSLISCKVESNAQVTSLQNDVASANLQITALKKDLREMSEKNICLMDEINAANANADETDHLKEVAHTMEVAAECLRNQLAETNFENQILRNKVAQCCDEVKNLKTEIALKICALQNIEQEVEVARAFTVIVQKKLHDTENKNIRLCTEIGASKAAKVDNTDRASEIAIVTIDEKMSENATYMTDLQSRLDQALIQNNLLKDTEEKFVDTIDCYRNQLNELQKRYDALNVVTIRTHRESLDKCFQTDDFWCSKSVCIQTAGKKVASVGTMISGELLLSEQSGTSCLTSAKVNSSDDRLKEKLANETDVVLKHVNVLPTKLNSFTKLTKTASLPPSESYILLPQSVAQCEITIPEARSSSNQKSTPHLYGGSASSSSAVDSMLRKSIKQFQDVSNENVRRRKGGRNNLGS